MSISVCHLHRLQCINLVILQARFELDEEFQRIAVLNQMENLWRSYKSRIVKDINEAANNQQRMNMRPMHVSPTDWRKFVKFKTSTTFKILILTVFKFCFLLVIAY